MLKVLRQQSGSAAPVRATTWLNVSTVAPLAALLVLFVIGGFTNPFFLSLSNLQSIAVATSILIVLSIGQTFVISTGGIDLSIAAIVQLCGVVLAISIKHLALAEPIAFILVIVVGGLAGALNGVLVNRLKVSDFVVTLGSYSVLTGVTLVISNATPISIVSPTLVQITTGSFLGVSWLVTIAIVVALLAHVLMFHTAFGIHLLALGGNRKAAEALGLHTHRLKIAVYCFAGCMGGLGGILMVARLGAAEPTAGASYQLTSIAAVVLGGVSLFGGKSTIFGPVCGAFVLTGIVNLLTISGVPVFYQPIAVGLVVLVAAFLGRVGAR